jgi:hypothetical protein
MKNVDIVSNRRYLKCLIELKRSMVVVVVVVVQLGLVYLLTQESNGVTKIVQVRGYKYRDLKNSESWTKRRYK